jgi:membrane protease YdiL (CAAX protease family)
MTGMTPTDPTARSFDWRPVHAWILIVFMAAVSAVPTLAAWPWIWLLPLIGYGFAVWLSPPLRASFRGWRFGRVNGLTVGATVTIAVLSSVALVTYHALARPEVSALARFFTVPRLGGLVAFGMLFAVLNALMEELIFRGVLFDAAESQWGNKIAVVATAVFFGYGHRHGYPPGAIGAVLAGVYGLCLGWLRVFSGGLGLPFLAHIAADATIFTLVVQTDLD